VRGQEAVDRRAADRHARFGQPGAQLLEREVRRLGQQPLHQLEMRRQRVKLRAPDPARRGWSVPAVRQRRTTFTTKLTLTR